MTVGERNMRQRIKGETVRRQTLWESLLFLVCYFLMRAGAVLLTVYVGVLWPYYVWLHVWPADHDLAVQIWALVLVGWGIVGLVWSVGRTSP